MGRAAKLTGWLATRFSPEVRSHAPLQPAHLPFPADHISLQLRGAAEASPATDPQLGLSPEARAFSPPLPMDPEWGMFPVPESTLGSQLCPPSCAGLKRPGSTVGEQAWPRLLTHLGASPGHTLGSRTLAPAASHSTSLLSLSPRTTALMEDTLSAMCRSWDSWWDGSSFATLARTGRYDGRLWMLFITSTNSSRKTVREAVLGFLPLQTQALPEALASSPK